MNAFTFSNNQKGCTVRHGASNKIKYFRVLLYMGSQAESRYTLERSRFSEEKREKERVTPECGEGKEEKNLPPNSGHYSVPADQVLGSIDGTELVPAGSLRAASGGDPMPSHQLISHDLGVPSFFSNLQVL